MFICECKECIVTDQIKDWYKFSKNCNYIYHTNKIDTCDTMNYRLSNGIISSFCYYNRIVICSYEFDNQRDGFYNSNLIQEIPKEEYTIEYIANYLKKISENLIFV